MQRVETRLPGCPGKPVVVESRIVPGTALGACFADGYPAEDDPARYRLALYRHVPDLALTVLADADGRTLFSGVRHGLIRSSVFGGQSLAWLAVEELKDVVDAILFSEPRHLANYGAAFRGHRLLQIPVDQSRDPADGFPCAERGEDYRYPSRAQVVERIAQEIRRGGTLGENHARTLERQAKRLMAMETAAAALVADPERFQRALDRETVDLDLFAISLATTNNFGLWGLPSHTAFFQIAVERPPALHMRGSEWRGTNDYGPHQGSGIHFLHAAKGGRIHCRPREQRYDD